MELIQNNRDLKKGHSVAESSKPDLEQKKKKKRKHTGLSLNSSGPQFAHLENSLLFLYLPLSAGVRKIRKILDIREERCHHLEGTLPKTSKSLPCTKPPLLDLPPGTAHLRPQAAKLLPSTDPPHCTSGGTPSLRKSAQLSSLLVRDPPLSQTPLVGPHLA